MSAEIQNLIQRYGKGIQVFEDALRGLTPEVADRVPAPGKWSIRQIAVHLADSELVTAVRLRWVAAQPGSKIPAYDQDTWTAKLAYEKQSLDEILELFRAVRRATATLLRHLPEEAWANTGNHEERGVVTFKQFVELYTDHAEHHSRQIRDLRSKFAAAA